MTSELFLPDLRPWTGGRRLLLLHVSGCLGCVGIACGIFVLFCKFKIASFDLSHLLLLLQPFGAKEVYSGTFLAA